MQSPKDFFYVCNHISCNKRYKHCPSRSKHQNKNHSNCTDECIQCEKINEKKQLQEEEKEKVVVPISQIITTTTPPTQLVKCRHIGCNKLMNTKHRRRHETGNSHKKSCGPLCIACNRVFKKGRQLQPIEVMQIGYIVSQEVMI